MSKGYILVDMPEKCSQCNFWFGKATVPVEYRCMTKQRQLENLTEKPDWCPIRELPKKNGSMRKISATRETCTVIPNRLECLY